jgi:hypothetical protein|tara:strand:+ start:851 stop:973 length:123 start_codon:yes stop_codon:yes gene_type:complete
MIRGSSKNDSVGELFFAIARITASFSADAPRKPPINPPLT